LARRGFFKEDASVPLFFVRIESRARLAHDGNRKKQRPPNKPRDVIVSPSFSHLPAPGRDGTMTLRNRIFMAPMGSNPANADGTPGDKIKACIVTYGGGLVGIELAGHGRDGQRSRARDVSTGIAIDS